ncbi:hypothetical protein Efla_007676 [Eimeria flavescens]
MPLILMEYDAEGNSLLEIAGEYDIQRVNALPSLGTHAEDTEDIGIEANLLVTSTVCRSLTKMAGKGFRRGRVGSGASATLKARGKLFLEISGYRLSPVATWHHLLRSPSFGPASENHVELQPAGMLVTYSQFYTLFVRDPSRHMNLLSFCDKAMAALKNANTLRALMCVIVGSQQTKATSSKSPLAFQVDTSDLCDYFYTACGERRAACDGRHCGFAIEVAKLKLQETRSGLPFSK